MELGIVEDFTSNVQLDSELTLKSKTGIILNSGVHPSITLDNLLQFLPVPDLEFEDYNSEVTYQSYSKTRFRKNIVSFQGKLYQCLSDISINVDPSNSATWMETNKESLILKSFIDRVKDKVISDLKLSRRLINSQYLYEFGKHEIMLPHDYSAWVFEAKGSDYVQITLNEISLQALTNDPVNLYVINEKELVDTLVIHPKNGNLSFEKLNYTFSGPGRWIFAINSQKVLTNSGWLDEMKYDGFVCYTASGVGLTPQSSNWNYFNNSGNGLGFNVSVTLESDSYLEYNLINLTSFIKASFELMAFQMFLNNSNNRSNRNIQLDKENLMFETKDLQHNTIAKRYYSELKEARKTIQKTFDTQLGSDDGYEVETSSI
ncbi:hypothetical protein [Chryseobacterium indoltheticum]|uniref:Uncharacterized protein n=1 Tax=Chryseobacterium indoltheticum TaxID=254 RepID=A0A381FAD2_9FLAO|nr:hypothetical protein [Chryseobacterium indoltheticum]AZA73571.1 hypothetical protein EG358_07295 [Chryseobacterium indoltheticum]SIR24047.1 hypothetical protein SAMN05421682_11583 [Chryseobacterium indoltheticum]SUX43530.1 Uncharacterised protein [Chryseobacterium indoltheticum]